MAHRPIQKRYENMRGTIQNYSTINSSGFLALFIGVFMVLILSRCASAPEIIHPDLGIKSPVQKAPGDTLNIAEKWWEGFHDAGLDSVLLQALAHNYSLKAAAARMEAAAAQSTIAAAGLFPSLDLGFSSSRRKQNFIGFPIPGSTGKILTTRTTTYGVSANVSWEIDLWGRIRSAGSAAEGELQATEADFAAARLSVAAQTAKAWFASVEARLQEKLARENFNADNISQQQIRLRYEKGLRPSLDYRLALSNVATAEVQLVARQQQFAQIRRQLELLLGKYPSAQIDIADRLPTRIVEMPGYLPSDLLQRRPDVFAAERRLAASHASVWAARAALFPRISFSGSAGGSNNLLNELLNKDFSVWSLAGNLLQPIFHSGQIIAGIDVALARQKQAFAVYAQKVLQAYAEVENLLSGSRYLRKQSNAARLATDEAKAAAQLAQQRYNKGLSDIITLLQARQRANSASSQFLSIQRAQLDNQVDLYLALGGGYKALKGNQSLNKKDGKKQIPVTSGDENE